MTTEAFVKCLDLPNPPADLHPLLTALWHDARGDWQTAHSIAQSQEGTQSYDRLHAYLHRKEGDASNARYWYRRAGADLYIGSLDDEWKLLVSEAAGS